MFSKPPAKIIIAIAISIFLSGCAKKNSSATTEYKTSPAPLGATSQNLSPKQNSHDSDGALIWLELMSQADSALKQKLFAEAELYCREAMKRASNFTSGENQLATNFVILAEIQRRQSQPDQAEQSLKTAVALCEKTFGPNDLRMVMSLETLANFYYFAQHQPDRALPLSERILRLVKTHAPNDTTEIAKRVRALATIHREQKRYALAAPHYERLLALAEKNPTDLTATLLKTADFYREWGQWPRAEELCQRALAIVEKNALTNNTPEAQIDLAVSLYGLAQIYHDGGKSASAEPLYRRSLAVAEKIAGPDHPDLIHPLSGLAGALSDQNKTAEAETLYRRALTIEPTTPKPNVAEQYAALLTKMNRADEGKILVQDHQWRDLMRGSAFALKQTTGAEAKQLCEEALQLAATFGPRDTRYAQSQVQLANVYRRLSQPVLAEQTLLEALANCEKAVGPDDADVMIPIESLVNLYSFRAGQPEKIIPLNRRLLDLTEKSPRRTDEEVAFRVRNLADAYQAMGQFAEAEPFYRQTLALTEKAPDQLPYHLITVANFYRAWGKTDQAEALAKQVVQIRERAAATNDNADAKLDLAVALDCLGEIYLIAKKPALAESLYRRALALIESFSDQNNPDLAPRLVNLATALRNQGQPDQAAPQYQRAMYLIEKSSGPGAVELADVLEKYGALLKEKNQTAESQALLTRAETIRKQSVQ